MVQDPNVLRPGRFCSGIKILSNLEGIKLVYCNRNCGRRVNVGEAMLVLKMNAMALSSVKKANEEDF